MCAIGTEQNKNLCLDYNRKDSKNDSRNGT